MLHDVDFEKLKNVSEGYGYLNLREYVDQYEIYDSARMLANLYGMRVYPIRSPKDIGERALTEPMILVGHGGGGTFMNLDADDVIAYLVQWGMQEGTKTVLAGCNTSEATSLIGKIKAITGVEPVTNPQLAFTTKQSEYLVQDKTGLFDTRNASLQQAERNLMKSIGDDLLTWFNVIDKENYEDAKCLVDMAKQQFAKAKPMQGIAKEWNTKSSEHLQKEWNALIKQIFMPAKMSGEQVQQRIDTLLQFLKSAGNRLSGSTKSKVRDLSDNLFNYFKSAYKEAREAMRAFLTELRSPEVGGKGKGIPTSYLLRTDTPRSDKNLLQYYGLKGNTDLLKLVFSDQQVEFMPTELKDYILSFLH